MINLEPVEVDPGWWACNLVDAHGNRWVLENSMATSKDESVLDAHSYLQELGERVYGMFSLVLGKKDAEWSELSPLVQEAWMLSGVSVSLWMSPTYMEATP